MKIKTYIGLIFILSTFLLNHVDILFPNFTEFTIFGNNFKIMEGLNSSDIIWTVVQKINLVLFAGGFLLLYPFSIIKKKLLTRIIILLLVTSIVFNSVLAVGAVHDYVDGFGDGMYFITSLLLIISISIASIVLIKVIKIDNNRNNELIKLRIEVQERIEALKKKDFNMSQVQSKVESIQDTNLFITKKIEALECLPLFIKETDDMGTWTKLAHRRAMMIYGELDKQLKEIEDTKTIAV